MGIYSDKNMASMPEKEKEYEKYIEDHIDNVSKAFRAYGEQICIELNITLNGLIKVVQQHDKSKYDVDEFFSYRRYFYPAKGETPDKEEMDLGWLSHIHNNPHHWNYWIITDEDGTRAIDMPNIYIAEMLLDWLAMSMHFKSDVHDFWNSHKGKMTLTKDTITAIERCLANIK